ncbi:11020_t:CDS:1, partial [Dentiscutata erythropus]
VVAAVGPTTTPDTPQNDANSPTATSQKTSLAAKNNSYSNYL